MSQMDGSAGLGVRSSLTEAAAPPGSGGSAGNQPLLLRRGLNPDLAVWRGGQGAPTLVLVHGFGEGAFVWQPILEAMATPAFVAPDLRGHGHSAWDPLHRYETVDHVMDLAAILGSLHLDDIILVGHSLGAAVSLHLAAMHPDRFRGLVLVDYSPDMDAAGSAAVCKAFRDEQRSYESPEAYISAVKRARPLAEKRVVNRIAPRALMREEQGYILRRDPALALPSGTDPAVEAAEMWRALPEIRCPILIARGVASALVSPASVARMVAVARDARLITIARAGHAVMMDNPRGLAAEIETFRADLDR